MTYLQLYSFKSHTVKLSFILLLFLAKLTRLLPDCYLSQFVGTLIFFFPVFFFFLLSHFSPVQLCVTLWTFGTRLFCPWDSPGKNTGMGCYFLLQGISLTQGLNLSYISCIGRRVLYTSATWEAPNVIYFKHFDQGSRN